MFKNFPVILLNNFMRPSAEEKTDLINQIIEPKIKLNNKSVKAIVLTYLLLLFITYKLVHIY